MDNFDRLSAIQMNELNDAELEKIDGGLIFLLYGIGIALLIAIAASSCD